MNEVIQQLKAHRSIRKFKPEPVTEEQLKAMLDAAQMASSSNNAQAYSVIGVTDPAIKEQVAILAGNQRHVAECPLFLVWCADLHRLKTAIELDGSEKMPNTNKTENFIVGTVDTALAAQNAAVAAESMGLGILYVGGIRNNPKELSRLLGLPQLVYPVFGMCVGVPDQEPILRPRLPQAAIYHRNRYSSAQVEEHLQQYDAVYRQYMLNRSGGKRDTIWTKDIATNFRQKQREHMKSFLEEQGFELR